MGASNVECDDLASIDIRTYLLTKESMSNPLSAYNLSLSFFAGCQLALIFILIVLILCSSFLLQLVFCFRMSFKDFVFGSFEEFLQWY